MASFAQHICDHLKKNNISFQIHDGFDEKESMILRNGKEFIQIMEYKEAFLLSWAMPIEKATKYIHLVNKVEFDEQAVTNIKYKNQEKFKYSANWGTYSDTSEFGHICIPLHQHLLWHLVIGEQQKKSNISEKWVTNKIIDFKNKMNDIA